MKYKDREKCIEKGKEIRFEEIIEMGMNEFLNWEDIGKINGEEIVK